MPLLNLKTLSSIANSGSAAISNAGELFDRAAKSFTAAAQTGVDAKKAQYDDVSTTNTQNILNELRSIRSPEEAAAIAPDYLDQADQQTGGAYDRAAVSAELNGLLTKSREAATTDYNYNRTLENRTAQPVADQYGQRIANLSGRADANQLIDEINNLDIAPRFKTQLINDAYAKVGVTDKREVARMEAERLRRAEATDAYKRGVNLSNINISPDKANAGNVLGSLQEIDRLANDPRISPLERAAFKQELRTNAGLTKDVVLQSLYDLVNPKGVPAPGFNVDAVLTAAASKYAPGIVNSGDVGAFLDKKDADTGQDTIKANAQDLIKRERDLDFSIRKAQASTTSIDEYTTLAHDLLSKFAENSMFDFGQKATEIMQPVIATGLQAGVPFATVTELILKYGRGTNWGNADSAGFKIEMNKAIEAARAGK